MKKSNQIKERQGKIEEDGDNRRKAVQEKR